MSRSSPQHPDIALIERVARGEEAAVADLYAAYGRVALAVALRVTRDVGLAEDAVQDALVGAWRGAGRYSDSRASARTWLLAIVHHRAVDIVRRRGNVAEAARLDGSPAEASLSDLRIARDLVWGAVGKRLDAAELRTALESLPAPQRQAIELAYFGGYTHLEIARLTATPLGTVKSRMRAALAALRRDLEARRMGPAPREDRRRASAIARRRAAA